METLISTIIVDPNFHLQDHPIWKMIAMYCKIMDAVRPINEKIPIETRANKAATGTVKGFKMLIGNKKSKVMIAG